MSYKTVTSSRAMAYPIFRTSLLATFRASILRLRTILANVTFSCMNAFVTVPFERFLFRDGKLADVSGHPSFLIHLNPRSVGQQ